MNASGRGGRWRRVAGLLVGVAAGWGVAAWGQPMEADDPRPPEAVVFDAMPKVETAALYTQTLKEAPAKVTVITRQDIRRFGYRTLAEALGNATGFYTTYDGVDSFVGIRGFSLLGDYNTRILVMLNGHSLTDNVYGAMYMFGQSFGVDMDLIERIEVVRGPSSALYGSNGVFATVNIFTRSPADAARGYVSTEFGRFGEKKVIAAASAYLGRGASLVAEVSSMGAHGRTAFIENTLEAGGGGWAHRLDSTSGFHSFAQLTWRGWSVTANFGSQKAIHDGGWFGAVIGDTETSNRDAHNFVEAAWRRNVGAASEFSWRLSYDQFRYDGRYVFPAAEDERAEHYLDTGRGDWLGTRFIFRTAIPNLGNLIVGAEGRADLRMLQREYVREHPEDLLLDATRRNVNYGVFAQQEVVLSPQWSFFFGVRGDGSRLYQRSITPRAGIVYQRNAATTIKYLYGKAYRDPSAYERFYVPSPALAPERAKTYELVVEQSLGRRIEVAASAYHYRITGLIEGQADSEGFMYYRNGWSRRANGLEVEVQTKPGGVVEIGGSLAIQSTRSGGTSGGLANSPGRVAVLRASVPLAGRRLFLNPAVRYISGRLGGFRTPVPGRLVGDVTVSTERLHRNFDVVGGVRNLAGQRYLEPVSEEHLGNTYPLAGRTAFIKLIWHTGE